MWVARRQRLHNVATGSYLPVIHHLQQPTHCQPVIRVPVSREGGRRQSVWHARPERGAGARMRAARACERGWCGREGAAAAARACV